MSKKQFFEYFFLITGAVAAAVGVKLFLVPSEIAPAGFSGIAAIINYLSDIPIGILILFLNIPFFFLSLKEYGRKFVLRTVIAVLIFSFFSDLFENTAVTEDMLLSSIYGGIVFGVGIGLVLKGGGTTGGTELLAKLIFSRSRSVSLGGGVFIIDAIIIAASCFVFGVESSLYAVISLFITSKMIDIINYGVQAAKAYIIISDSFEEIEKEVFIKLKRGVTRFYAKGSFSQREKSVLLCVVGSLVEASLLKEIVAQTDKSAFVIAVSANEVLGYGFEENGGNLKNVVKKRPGIHNGRKNRDN